MKRCWPGSIAILLLAAAVGAAQSPRRRSVPGSTVQLPTLSTFSTSTSVLVPDSGVATMGGVGRAAEGRGGSEVRSAQSGVRVQIHDFAAMEKELLNQAAGAPAGGTGGEPPTRPQSSSADRPAMSIEAARQARQSEVQAAQGEALAWIERAVAAEADGRTGAAKVYYQMAARRADSPMRQSIRARLESLGKRR